jgi:hypothetical protein
VHQLACSGGEVLQVAGRYEGSVAIRAEFAEAHSDTASGQISQADRSLSGSMEVGLTVYTVSGALDGGSSNAFTVTLEGPDRGFVPRNCRIIVSGTVRFDETPDASGLRMHGTLIGGDCNTTYSFTLDLTNLAAAPATRVYGILEP